MARPESTFPTIRDARDALAQLVDKGLGDLPIQLVIVPASTLAVIAKDAGHTGPKPALMVEITAHDGAESGVLLYAVEAMQSTGAH
jgi:hypothetical protein